MPQAAAGPRIEPPVSEPNVAGASPAATAAAEPDDDPAGEYAVFQGLRAGGNRMSQDGPPCANSHVSCLPSNMPPASASLVCTAASRAGTLSARSFDMAVVRMPAVS